MSASFRSAGDSHKLLPSTDRKHLKVSLKHYVVNVEGAQQQNDHIDLEKQLNLSVCSKRYVVLRVRTAISPSTSQRTVKSLSHMRLYLLQHD